ncbi:hypothetical protein [Polycladidibacter stylochi]|uniref:hypothetical protein n=1 Tax=Polycladidibacter stylochi TaxID=1807766 RepID=UPI00082C1E4C|nr:hypothetical protein [Pseudovibrio stylochi]
MSTWEKFLSTIQLDDNLIDEIRTELGTNFNKDMESTLLKPVSSKKELSNIRKILLQIKPFITKDLRDDLNFAVREMSCDIDYMQSDLGKTVLVLNRWLEPWYTNKIRNNPAYDDILISGNAEDVCKIYVVGKIGSQEELEQLKSLIDTKNPPFTVVYNVQINN